MRRDAIKIHTPLQQLVVRLEEAYDLNPMEPDYREGLAEALSMARGLLSQEQQHIVSAWYDGSGGILNQSGEQYFRDTYTKI